MAARSNLNGLIRLGSHPYYIQDCNGEPMLFSRMLQMFVTIIPDTLALLNIYAFAQQNLNKLWPGKIIAKA